MKIGLSQKILLLMVAPTAVSLFLILWLAFMLDGADRAMQRESRSRELRKECSALSAHIDSAIQAVNHYCATNGSNPQQMDSAHASLVKIYEELERVPKIIGGNAEQNETLATILFLRDRLTNVISKCEAEPSPLELEPLWQLGAQLNLELRKLHAYEDHDDTLHKQRAQNLLKFLLYGTFLDIAVAIFLVTFFVRPILQRLSFLDQNNKRFAKQEPLVSFASGTDELAELDRTFRDTVSTLSEYVRKEQAMVENANDVICLLDPKLTFVKVNHAIVATLGYAQEEIPGRSLCDFLPETQIAQVQRNAAEAINSEAPQSFEITMKRKEGPLVILSCGVHWSSADNVFFCILHDITERKRVSQLKQDFVAMVSHDLRAPLMSIQATLTMLQADLLGELTVAGKKTLAGAERSTHSLLALITGILDIEKLESGRFLLSKDSICVDVLIERSIDMVRNLADKKELSFQSTKSDVWIYVDEDRMVQVMTNLLSNAIKFSPRGSVIVTTVSVTPSYVEVRISDRGRGVPPNMRTSIFERFKQVKLSDSREKGGSGLGLAICKSIVEAHYGTVGVDSEDGKGSSFWFRLPATPDEQDEEQQLLPPNPVQKERAASDQQSQLSDAPSTASDPQSQLSDAPSTASDPQSQLTDAPSTASDPQSQLSDAPSTASDQQSQLTDAPSTASDPQSQLSDAPSTASDQQSQLTDAPITASDQQSQPSDAPSTASDPQSQVSDAPEQLSQATSHQADSEPQSADAAALTNGAVANDGPQQEKQ